MGQIRPDVKARERAAREGIDIRFYNVIYNALDDIENSLKGMLKPEYEEVQSGVAEIREVFRSSKFGAVAGSMVVEGTVKRNKPIRVLRNNTVIFQGELESLRRYKEIVDEVRMGTDCGIAVKQYNDVKPGDMIECFERIEFPRTL